LANTIAAGEIATDLDDNDRRTRMARPGCVGHDAFHDAPPTQCEPGLDPERPLYWAPTTLNGIQAIHGSEERRGMRWAWAQSFYTGMFTILPPNREVCGRCNHETDAINPPSSRHQGGCHVLMADGAVVFITDSIEAGDQTSRAVGARTSANLLPPGSKSPYGLWGALGTRGSKETIEEQLNQ
jgi:prepilin-type processing-associated H-X9-DG protein